MAGDPFGPEIKWTGAGSNRRHMDFQSIALPTELPVHPSPIGIQSRKVSRQARSLHNKEKLDAVNGSREVAMRSVLQSMLHRNLRAAGPFLGLLATAALAVCLCAPSARAVTPESPEVKKLIAAGLAFLDKAPQGNGRSQRLSTRRQVSRRTGLYQSTQTRSPARERSARSLPCGNERQSADR